MQANSGFKKSKVKVILTIICHFSYKNMSWVQHQKYEAQLFLLRVIYSNLHIFPITLTRFNFNKIFNIVKLFIYRLFLQHATRKESLSPSYRKQEVVILTS